VDLGGPAMARIARDHDYTFAELRKLSDDEHAANRAALRRKPGNWHYHVPALHINGGGIPSRKDAEHDCVTAIAIALEGDPRDYDTDAHTLTFDVTVTSAA
jgi:hypothetical protein